MEVRDLTGHNLSPFSGQRVLRQVIRTVGCSLTSRTQLWPHPWNTVAATGTDEAFYCGSVGGIGARRTRSDIYHSPRTEVPRKAKSPRQTLHEDSRGSPSSAGDTGQV